MDVQFPELRWCQREECGVDHSSASGGYEGVDEGAGRRIETLDATLRVARYIQVAVRAERDSGRVVEPISRSEDIHKGAGRPIIAQHIRSAIIGDIEVAVQSERDPERINQSAAGG